MRGRCINEQRIVRDVITVGASAGGVEALLQLLSKLPAALPAIIGIVLHRNPVMKSFLAFLLGRHAGLPVLEPQDGQPVERGTVYLAPRDHHMTFTDGVIRLSRGPLEHRTRPAVDPLFRSAAKIYGARVVGVLLSGMGTDGVPGLIDITAGGGLSLVQRPDQALYPSMPSMAIRDDSVDGVFGLEEMAVALTVLASGGTVRANGEQGVS